MLFRPLILVTAVLAACTAAAEVAQPVTPPPAATAGAVEAGFTAEELESLVGPIALHPDPLVALILPASTAPSEIVLAARKLQTGASVESFEDEPWDDSVKALARYPDLLRWMDENLQWTTQLGEAFATHPAEVMNSIQRLRARARAAGTLADNAQQHVVEVEEEIRIVPARTDVIYIPRYSPAVVYVDRPVYRSYPLITFGIGYSVGYWLSYDCDWRGRTIWAVPRWDRKRYWHDHWPRSHGLSPRDYWMRRHDHRWHAWHPRTSWPHHKRPHFDHEHKRDRERDRERGNHWDRGPEHRLDRDRDRNRWTRRDDLPRRVDSPSAGQVTWRRPEDRDRRRNVGHQFRPDATPRPERPVYTRPERPRFQPDRSGGNLPSGPVVRPVAPIVPPATVSRIPNVRPTPSVRPATPLVAPNGRVIPRANGERGSSRGSFTQAPNGRQMPSGNVRSSERSGRGEGARAQFQRPSTRRDP